MEDEEVLKMTWTAPKELPRRPGWSSLYWLFILWLLVKIGLLLSRRRL